MSFLPALMPTEHLAKGHVVRQMQKNKTVYGVTQMHMDATVTLREYYRFRVSATTSITFKH